MKSSFIVYKEVCKNDINYILVNISIVDQKG